VISLKHLKLSGSKSRRNILITGLILAGCLLVFLLMWRSGSSLENPSLAKASDHDSYLLDSIAKALRLWDYPRLNLDTVQEGALLKCIGISRLVNSFVNGTAKFDKPEVKEQLLALRDEMKPGFYPEFLLAYWCQRKGQIDESRRWMEQSLEHAPVVLIREYQFVDGRALADTEVGKQGIECRMKTATNSNQSHVLLYPGLITDSQGRILLPCYDTEIRSSSVTYPKGYEIETGRHGYLTLYGDYCQIPSIYVWNKGSPRPVTSLPASSFYDYHNASQAQGLKHRLGVAEFAIERCYRWTGAGTVLATDGRTAVEEPKLTSLPQLPQPPTAMDQAVIHFKRDKLVGHEIYKVRIFDHGSRTLLSNYHAPAAWDYQGMDEIKLQSLGKPLPDSVDVWFYVTSFNEHEKKQIVPLQIGSTVEFEGYKASLTHIHSGTRSYSSSAKGITFQKGSREDDYSMQVAFKITPRGNVSGGLEARVAAVTIDGKRFFCDRVIRSGNRNFVVDFEVALGEVKHLELYPLGKEEFFFFNDVRLPEIQDQTLDQSWSTVVETHGQQGSFSNASVEPAQVTVSVFPGNNSMSMESYSEGLLTRRLNMRWRYGQENRNMDTYATIVCEMKGLSSRMLKTEFEALGANGEVLDGGRSSLGGTMTYRHCKVALNQIQAVRVRLSWSVE